MNLTSCVNVSIRRWRISPQPKTCDCHAHDGCGGYLSVIRLPSFHATGVTLVANGSGMRYQLA